MRYDILGEHLSRVSGRSEQADVIRCLVIRERRQAVNYRIVTCPSAAADILSDVLEGADREHVIALLVDTKNALLGIHTVSIGSLNEAIIHPRETYKAACILGASAILLAHNHPSGDPTPSPEDIEVTQRIAAAGRVLGIELLDHVFIGAAGTFRSLRQLGHI